MDPPKSSRGVSFETSSVELDEEVDRSDAEALLRWSVPSKGSADQGSSSQRTASKERSADRTIRRKNSLSAALAWLAYRCHCTCSPSRRAASADDLNALLQSEALRSSNLFREEGLTRYGVTLIKRILGTASTMSDKQRKDLAALKQVLDKLHDQEMFEQRAFTTISDFGMDEDTERWLMGTFAGQDAADSPERASSFRKAAQAVQAGVRMKNLMMLTKMASREVLESVEPLCLDASLNEDLDVLGSWKEFDIFRLERNARGRPLFPVAYATLQKRGLIDRFHLPERKLELFLNHVEDKYSKTNAYHNAIHAADVVQTVYMMTANLPFSELENLAALLAAACHDVGHPGVTNDFRIKEADEDAITYSDKSVNEYMHCALTYRIMRREDCNFLAGLTAEQRSTVRKLVVGIILSTDMAMHFSQLSKLVALIDTKGKDVSKFDDTPLVLENVVHASDISAVSKPRSRALLWTDRVLEEFFAQGDRERELKRDISPLCDRNTVSKANAQVGFINFIVKPTFEALNRIDGIPDAKEALENMQSYHDFWKAEMDKEPVKKSPSRKASRTQ